MEMENRLSPNRLDSQVHAHRSKYVRAIEHEAFSKDIVIKSSPDKMCRECWQPYGPYSPSPWDNVLPHFLTWDYMGD
jgi:hypothetical protein